MTINNPDIDPANNYSLVGAINFAFQKMQQNVNGMLPAQVLSYDRVNNRVSVQLLINIITTGGQSISRAVISSIPVLCLGGGTFSISFPVTAGDLGWVLANDRDISNFLQTYSQIDPNSTRQCNFADSVFYPDVMKSYNISDSNTDYLIIQSNDGTMSIAMGINSSSTAHEININCDRLNLTVNSGTGYVNIDGNLFVSGLIQNPTGAVVAQPTVPPFPP
jgi:Phage protein Gp138 N-terminal domain